MADRGIADEFVDRAGVITGEVFADMAKAAVGVELLTVTGDDAGRFLSAVLEGMKAESGMCSRVGGSVNTKYRALLAQMVIVEVGGDHRQSSILVDRPTAQSGVAGAVWRRRHGGGRRGLIRSLRLLDCSVHILSFLISIPGGTIRRTGFCSAGRRRLGQSPQ